MNSSVIQQPFFYIQYVDALIAGTSTNRLRSYRMDQQEIL